jgi:hypothetical protein
MTRGLQRSSVLPTRAFSESISNVNLSFCTLRNIFIWVLVRDGHSGSCIWNPYEVYSRYMPGIFHVYVGPPYIHGIYYVYAKYIRILVLCISWSFNVVNPCHGWGQSNVEDITFQHSIILRESNATWFHGIYLTYTCIYLVYARHIPCWVIFNFGTLTGTLWK